MDKQNETILKILKQDSRFTAAQIAAAVAERMTGEVLASL